MHITLKDIISIVMFVFLLFVINRQARIIGALESEIDNLKLENKRLKDKK